MPQGATAEVVAHPDNWKQHGKLRPSKESKESKAAEIPTLVCLNMFK